MNEETPFTIHGDEPVEARIVSWVLGEASAFEAAELERLCGERPELRVFHRRMLALHGLVAEAERPEGAWKLPEDKRRVLEELYGEETAVRLEVKREMRVRQSGRRAFLAIAACVVISLIVLKFFDPWTQVGEVTMEIRPRVDGGAMEKANGRQASPQFFGTEFEKIKSRATLEKVVENLDLDRRWGIDKESAIEELKNKVEPRKAPESDMVKIRVRDANEQDAKDIALEVARSYKVYRDESEARDSERRLHALNKAVRDQEDKVEERRKVLSSIARTKGIVYRGGDSFYNQSGVDAARGAREVVENLHQLEQEKMQLESQIGSMRKYDSDQLMVYASGLDLPDNSVRTKYPEYLEKKRQLEGLRIAGLGDDHPSMKAANEQLATTRKELDEGVENLRETLEAKLDLTSDRLKQAEVMKEESRDEAIKRGLDAQDYVDAKREYEADRQLLAEMKIKQMGETISGRVPAESVVIREPEESEYAGVKEKANAPAKPAAPSSSMARAVPLAQPTAEARGLAGNVAEDEPQGGSVDPFVDGRKGGAVAVPGNRMENQSMIAGRKLKGESPELKPATDQTWNRSGDDAMAFSNPVQDQLPKNEAMGYKMRADSAEEIPELSDLASWRSSLMGRAGELGVDFESGGAGMGGVPYEIDYVDPSLVGEGMLLNALEAVAKAAPRAAPTELTAEVSAAEDPYSTFSLNVSDASFQVAQAALAKGEQPDPAGIKVEQFYNAVDYGDPAPAAGEPVAVAIEQCAHPVIPGRNLVRIALKTAAAGRSAAQPLRLTLLVDQSGSMVREDRRAAMDKALAGLTGLLTENDLVSVIGFSRTPRLLADGMKGNQAAGLADLVNQSAAEGGTNLEMAIALADQLAERRKLEGAQNRIVLFTDGAANLGNADPERLAEKVKALRQRGIAFDIAGIAADGLNDMLLGELARNGNGRYYVVGKGVEDDFGKQLAGAFRPAAENVKVQVRFNPERVGSYRLIGFEKDRLKTEDFRNDAVDAAELAAEEAGVAIYQVELLPDGRGEIGEVSVRFRDTAGDEMVERTWTIPHESAVPVFDRAVPSMQLAVLAMLAGEKLKGGPLADAIDFRQFAEPLGEVKQFFGGSRRVGEVLRMIDEMK